MVSLSDVNNSQGNNSHGNKSQGNKSQSVEINVLNSSVNNSGKVFKKQSFFSSLYYLKKSSLGTFASGLMTLSLGALLCAPVFAGEQENENIVFQAPKQIVPGRILLKLKNIEEFILKEGEYSFKLSKVRDSILDWQIYEVQHLNGEAFTEAETFDAISKLEIRSDIDGISVDYWQRKLSTPNDRLYPQMWHLDMMGAEASWDVTTGNSSQRIGVVDTGLLRAHEDLRSKDLAGYDFISDSYGANDGNGRDSNYNDSGDGANCGRGYQPSTYHGTHVSGTILAETNNNKGIAGINWNAKLVTVRALGRCGGSTIDIMEGSAWLAGKHIRGVPDLPASKRVSVINLSLGGSGRCSSFQNDTINYINSKGVLFVVAAGNASSSGNIVASMNPANCSKAIAVGAHNASNSRSSYSNFGDKIDIVAPGGDVSGDRRMVISSIGPGISSYDSYPGTSMAAPHVAGAISLFQAVKPNLTLSEVRNLFVNYSGTCTGCYNKPRLRADLILASLTGGNTDIDDNDGVISQEDDQYTDNSDSDSAVELACNSSHDLQMLSGDHDWFKVNTVIGSEVNVSIDSVGQYDLDLYLYEADGSTLLDRSRLSGGDESVSETSSPGEVMIDVASYGEAAGAYRLEIECTAANNSDVDVPIVLENVDTSFEPNDFKYQAKSLSCGDNYLLSVGDGRDDTDWFKLNVNNRQNYTIEIDGGQKDLDLFIFEGTSGRPVKSSRSADGTESISRRANSKKQYVQVHPYRRAKGEYFISLICTSSNSITHQSLTLLDTDNLNHDSEFDFSDIEEVNCAASTASSTSFWTLFSLLFIGLRARRKKSL